MMYRISASDPADAALFDNAGRFAAQVIYFITLQKS